MSCTAIIGGTGLSKLPGLTQLEEEVVTTPYGDPSAALVKGMLGQRQLIFLPRHGKSHRIPPHRVNYRANIWAMRSLGVRWLISVSAVGSLQEHLRPRDMVVPNQFIDRTVQRPQSFFGDGCVAHVSLADPFCERLSDLLASAASTEMPSEHRLQPSRALRVVHRYLPPAARN